MRRPRPDGMYGLSKAFGEDLSRFYFDRYGIETACVRIGSSFPEPKDRRMLATWLSFDDLHRLITACLTHAGAGPQHRVRHVRQRRDLVGQPPRAPHRLHAAQDSSDIFRDAVYARTPAPDLSDPAVQFQGGGFVKAGPFAD